MVWSLVMTGMTLEVIFLALRSRQRCQQCQKTLRIVMNLGVLYPTLTLLATGRSLIHEPLTLLSFPLSLQWL